MEIRPLTSHQSIQTGWLVPQERRGPREFFRGVRLGRGAEVAGPVAGNGLTDR